VELANSDNPTIRSMVLFDAIINNTDRKYGHILPSQGGAIYGCDHGVTFHEDPKLRTVLWQYAGTAFTEIEKELLERALQSVESLLTNLITPAEIAALKERINQLLESGTFPYPSEDWPAVPWPPF
jgi:uncharacterized repeat protein (TIGR03843 family)